MDELKTDYTRLSSRSDVNVTDICKLAESLLVLDTKANYIEGQCRRNNIVVDGILESSNEKWSDCEEKVKQLMQEKPKLDRNTVVLERAHRIEKPRNGNSTRLRPIVVKFLRYKDKEAVLERAKYLKDTNIYLNEDFPENVRQKRKELMLALRAARERGEIAYLRYDKLITHPSAQTKNGNDMKPK